ncbi:MAG: PmoA family protein [Pirellulales bacterium]|nr:PmoA family protein [Pirellulales bacterium]
MQGNVSKMRMHKLTGNARRRFGTLLLAAFSAVPAIASAATPTTGAESASLQIQSDKAVGRLTVFRGDDPEPILTQHARKDFRPYLHPIVAPDGRGVLTEASPDHHPHQTGLYWGFTRVNGRDYFHHPQGDHWRRVSATVLKAVAQGEHDSVQWETVYDLLDEDGTAILRESQVWTMREDHGTYVLDLKWTGHAKTHITIGKANYGGLFLRMPWHDGVEGAVRNSNRLMGPQAEGQRAAWVDVGMRVEGRDDLAHIAIFDHPKNPGFPLPWRVDGKMGVGPVRARLGDWTIAKNERASIQHQLVVYTGQYNKRALTQKWSKYSGQSLASVNFLSPEKAVENMTLVEGFEVEAYATEPMITQPMAFCWDDSGRMWVAENRDYETRGTGFSGSGDSRILILEDTDRDGVADSRKVFLEGIPFPAAIAVGFDGLWLGAPPNLLFVPDRNGDDRADTEDIEVRLTGWGIRDRHETINSFMWGPDGWLYGCQGFATASRVSEPEDEGHIYRHGEPFPTENAYGRNGRQDAWPNVKLAGEPVDFNGGVFRYHPLKRRFEVVAHGFSNPWGLDYDAKGQLFITACVIPHLWHVIPGGIYHRQGGNHFSPYVYSDITTIADHRHHSAHGGARIYQSDAFPDKYKNRIFMANIHQHAVLTDILEPSGSGYIGRHGDDFLLANDNQWVGFSIEIGPTGAVYVLDWHDANICGSEVIQKETGRIYRMAPTVSHAQEWKGRYGDLREQPNAALVKLQTSESDWHARRARLLLQQRATSGNLDSATSIALKTLFRAAASADHRLRALWTLHVTGGADAAMLLDALDDRDEHIRGWAIQLLCEDRAAPDEALQRFVDLARNDTSPVVRLYLAAALQRVKPDTQWAIAEELALHAEDAEDHNISKMIWFGIEPLVTTDLDRSLRLAGNAQLPLLTRHIARRLTDSEQLIEVVAAVSASPSARKQLLLGIRDGLEGQYDVRAPDNWTPVYDQLQTDGGEQAALALELAQQFGDNAAAEKLLALLKNGDAPIDQRRRALQGLAGRKRPELKAELLAMLDDDELRRSAVQAMAAYDEPQMANALLKRYGTLATDDKLDALHTLASRRSYGVRLTQAIADGRIPKRDVPAYLARVLRRVVGNAFVDAWGPIDAISADKEAMLRRFRALLTDEALASADTTRGRTLFSRTCIACHKLYGDGGAIGPELTGANRSNLEYLLGNILTPSAVIQDAYRMHIVLTDDGQIFSGVLVNENERQLQLRVVDRTEPVVIAKSQIESREIAPVSMMPNGLLENLTGQEVLDLIAYLQTVQQVPLPNVVE